MLTIQIDTKDEDQLYNQAALLRSLASAFEGYANGDFDLEEEEDEDGGDGSVPSFELHSAPGGWTVSRAVKVIKGLTPNAAVGFRHIAGNASGTSFEDTAAAADISVDSMGRSLSSVTRQARRVRGIRTSDDVIARNYGTRTYSMHPQVAQVVLEAFKQVEG